MSTHSSPIPSTPRRSGATRKARQVARRRNGWSLALVAGGLFLLVGVFLALVRPAGSSLSAIRPLRIGQPTSDFALTDLAGKPVQLSDYAGRPVLINAWATWCPPCRAEMPMLHEFYQQHQEEDFVLLAINAGESSGTVQQFIDQNGYTFPVLLDADSSVLTRLGVTSFPTSIFIGPDGVVKYIHIGLMTPAALQTKIAPLLASSN
jgi:peroxiredoxin